ncbi:gliding motility-associated C-terminal domain-containing protein [Solitalea koreensis]|nr:gliding motility-associated C-terminal domain-containing protein [Solitalea koreensis]
MSHIEGVGGTRGAQMALYITSDVSTSGTVFVNGIGSSQNFNVTANTVTELTIPTGAYVDNIQAALNKGIHIVSKDPIVVFAHIYAYVISGATLVLPTNTLGKDYYVLSAQPSATETYSYSQFMVIATEDATQVEITPSALTVNGNPAGVPFTVLLNKGEVYQVQSKTDLSGSHVASTGNDSTGCKRIAVFGGTTWSPLGCIQADTGDNLYQQHYPVSTWGREYITIPFATRKRDDFKIVASENNTIININGTIINLNAGQTYSTSSSGIALHITSNNPISVAQYSITQVCDGITGDPEMILLTPVEQNIRMITMYLTTHYQIVGNYINVLIKDQFKNSFRINGAAPKSAFIPVGNTGYVYLQEKLAAGSYTLSADSGFNAIAYGFGDIESYGYSAGSNIEEVDKKIIANTSIASNITGTCVNTPIFFTISLPYATSHLVWDFGNGQTFTVDNPVTSSTAPPYIYNYVNLATNNTVIYTQPGTYIIKAIATRNGLTGCEAFDELIYNLLIEDLPKVITQPVYTMCSNEPVVNIINLIGQRPSGKYTFKGDGLIDSLFNPATAGSGPHNIEIINTSINGNCSQLIDFIINVNPAPFVDAGDEIDIDLGETAQLNAKVSGDILDFTWAADTSLSNPNSLTPIVTPTKNTLYKLYVNSENGCTAVDSVLVRVYTDLEVPNAFSPNNDGVNDTWQISGIENYPDSQVYIYNRYGEKVFYSKGYGIPWDGARNSNHPLPPATYYYVIKPNNPRIPNPLVGPVTIIY